MERMDTGKLIGIILGVIFAMYLVINALVPQLAGWATAVSSVDETDYGWIIYLVFLIIMFAIAYTQVKKAGFKGV